MKRNAFIILLYFFTNNYLYSQVSDDKILKLKAIEDILKIEFVGDSLSNCTLENITENSEFILSCRAKNSETLKFYIYNEEKETIKQIYSNVHLKYGVLDVSTKFLFFYQSFYDVQPNYTVLSVYYNDMLFNIDTIKCNWDAKPYGLTISSDNKFAIVNSLIDLPEYYVPIDDDKFSFFSLDSLEKGVIYKTEMACVKCKNGHLIGDKYFFTKVNELDDMQGFSLKDIYVTPFNNLNDTIKIARFSDIKAISPDGKYILGTRQKDFANSPLAIFDVENKKYQLLLGRNYSRYEAFYSTKMKKFAVSTNDKIIYLDFPKEIPYDALHKGNPEYPWSEGLKIMKLLEYPTFSE